MQTHDKQTPWKNFLVVLEGNVENRAKKPKGSSQKKDKASTASSKAQAPESNVQKTQEVLAGSAEPVTISGDWAGPGTIALVSHTALGGLTVIQTEIPAGTQLQPLVTTDGVISLDASAVGMPVTVPFSIPISVRAFHRSFSINIRFCAHHRGRSRFRRHTGSGKDCGDIRSRSNREQSGFGWVCVCPGCYDGRDGLCRHPTGSHWKHSDYRGFKQHGNLRRRVDSTCFSCKYSLIMSQSSFALNDQLQTHFCFIKPMMCVTNTNLESLCSILLRFDLTTYMISPSISRERLVIK